MRAPVAAPIPAAAPAPPAAPAAPVAATPVAAIHTTPPPAGFHWADVGGVLVLQSNAAPATSTTTSTPAGATPAAAVPHIHGASSTPFPAPKKPGDSIMKDIVWTIAGVLFIAFLSVLIYNSLWGSGPNRSSLGILGNGVQQGAPDAFTPRSGQAPIATEFGTPKGFGARDYEHNCPAHMKPVVTRNCAKKPDGTVQCKIECR